MRLHAGPAMTAAAAIRDGLPKLAADDGEPHLLRFLNTHQCREHLSVGSLAGTQQCGHMKTTYGSLPLQKQQHSRQNSCMLGRNVSSPLQHAHVGEVCKPQATTTTGIPACCKVHIMWLPGWSCGHTEAGYGPGNTWLCWFLGSSCMHRYALRVAS